VKKAALLAAALAGTWILAGCEGSPSTVSKEDDKEIRNNFGRSLSPDEVSKMGGGKKDNSAGATAPDKKGG